jgi:hypothetical protein
VDTPFWVPGTPITGTAAGDGAFDETIETVTAVMDTTGLAGGRHTLFMRGRDAEGNWGAPTAQFFVIENFNPWWTNRAYLPIIGVKSED